MWLVASFFVESPLFMEKKKTKKMKYLRLFDEHDGYNAYKDSGLLLPNVSHCIQQEDVHYNPLETRLIVRYSVNSNDDRYDPHRYTKALYYYNIVLGANLFSKIEIDGRDASIEDLDAASGVCALSDGEHVVKYTLKNPTQLGVLGTDSQEQITSALFMRCYYVSSVEIPSTVTSIGIGAFTDCPLLSSVTIPNSVQDIFTPETSDGFGPFYYCYSFTNLSINTTSVKEGWFSSNITLTSVTLGNDVKTIEDGAFCACLSIYEGKSDIETINEKAFCDTTCIMVTYPNDAEKAYLGSTAFAAYTFEDGTMIPHSEIIFEEKH